MAGQVVALDAAGEQQLVDQRVHPEPRSGGLRQRQGCPVTEVWMSSAAMLRNVGVARISGLETAVLFCGRLPEDGAQAWPISRSRSVNHGTDTSNVLPPAIRSNSIARSSPPRSSSCPTTPNSPRNAASTA